MSRPIYLWVIKSKTKINCGFWRRNQHSYFASRTSLKNPHFSTDLHWQARLFVSKQQAEIYYFAKARAGFNLNKYSVSRKKFYVDSKNRLDYWKNRKALLS